MSRQTIAYQPALDGTRALAVAVVLLFHGRVSWMSGGYLGVSVFFTLSGYLITALLLAEQSNSGRVNAAAFYARRARRLLPAGLVCVVGVSLMAAAGWFRGIANLRRDALGAIFQVFNWVKLASGESYADLNAAQAGLKRPLDHFWSLAIEEQFYWLWPVTFIGLLALARRRPRLSPLVSVGILTGLSAIAAPVVAQVWGADAAYWATPARMSEILAGALVACWLRSRHLNHRELPARMALLAPVGFGALAVGCVLFPDGRGPAYQGAMPLVAAASAALIIGLQADGKLRTLLGTLPLVGLGKISYGVYLYHWPIFVLIDRKSWAITVGESLAIKSALTLAVAIASYYLVERPIRTATWMLPRRTLVAALAGTAVVAFVAVTIVPAASKYYGVDEAAAAQAAIDTGSVEPLVPLATSTTIAVSTVPATAVASTATANDTAPVPTVPAVTTTTELTVPPRPVRIVVVGDSTAEATGAGVVAWAAANPAFAQVTLVTGPGCGLVLGGYLELATGERDVTAECGMYVGEIVPQKVAELHPDVVMVMSTVWDVQDRRLTQNGPLLSPMDPAVEATMKVSLSKFTDSLLAQGVPRVVWVAAPTPLPSLAGGVDKQAEPDRHAVLHRVIATIAQSRPAVRLVDLAAWVRDQPIGTDREARIDGVHWTSEASLLIANEFLGPALVQAALS